MSCIDEILRMVGSYQFIIIIICDEIRGSPHSIYFINPLAKAHMHRIDRCDMTSRLVLVQVVPLTTIMAIITCRSTVISGIKFGLKIDPQEKITRRQPRNGPVKYISTPFDGIIIIKHILLTTTAHHKWYQ